MLLSTLIDGFILDCRARRLSKGTIDRAYEPCLRELSSWLDNPEIKAITSADLRRFVVELGETKKFARGSHPWMTPQDEVLSPATIHRYVRVIKTMFAWSVTEGLLKSNPSDTLRLPKIPKQLIEIFTRDEVDTLLEAAREVSYRNFAMLFLLLDSGIRRQELIDLMVEDVNVVSGIVRVKHGKGDKERAVRVGNQCRKILWRYASDHREPLHSEIDRFFLSRRGTALTASAVACIFTRLSRKTGIHAYPHKCRHTFATTFALRVPNAILLADALGHETLDMARRYVHFAGTMSTDVTSSPMDWLLSQDKRE